MSPVAEIKDLYLSEFERLEKSLPGLRDVRRRAIERFAQSGFPTGREEAWRFTDLTPVIETPFRIPESEANLSEVESLAGGPLSAAQLVFVDGRFIPSLSTSPAGIVAESLARSLETSSYEADLSLEDGHVFSALNAAFAVDGAVVRIPRGTSLAAPLHLLFLSTTREEPFVVYPRIRMTAEEGASVSVVESYVGGTGPHLTDAVVEVRLGDGASVRWCKLQHEGAEAYHVASIGVRLGRNSTFLSHSISLGAAISRNDLSVRLAGEGAECSLDGLYELTGGQLSDHHTTIDHAAPHGTSRELYKGILDGRSRGVFDGRILVRPEAQKTNAVQTNKNLLLSDGALVNTKPQLEIFANDVKCKHGATIGKLDPDVLFYLRSRGIGSGEARRLLIHAFACEVLDGIPIGAVREQLERYVLDLVARKGG